MSRTINKGPYVLVGHSFGGLNMYLYACMYPEEVAGLVLLDALSKDIHRYTPREFRYFVIANRLKFRVFARLTGLGVTRFYLRLRVLTRRRILLYICRSNCAMPRLPGTCAKRLLRPGGSVPRYRPVSSRPGWVRSCAIFRW